MCKQVITRSTVLFIKLPNYLNRISRRHCMVNGYDFRENKCRSCLWKGTYDRSISLLRGWLLHHTVLLCMVVYGCVWLLLIVVYHHRMVHHHGCCCVFGSKWMKNEPNTMQNAHTSSLERSGTLRNGLFPFEPGLQIRIRRRSSVQRTFDSDFRLARLSSASGVRPLGRRACMWVGVRALCILQPIQCILQLPTRGGTQSRDV